MNKYLKNYLEKSYKQYILENMSQIKINKAIIQDLISSKNFIKKLHLFSLSNKTILEFHKLIEKYIELFECKKKYVNPLIVVCSALWDAIFFNEKYVYDKEMYLKLCNIFEIKPNTLATNYRRIFKERKEYSINYKNKATIPWNDLDEVYGYPREGFQKKKRRIKNE